MANVESASPENASAGQRHSTAEASFLAKVRALRAAREASALTATATASPSSQRLPGPARPASPT
jgi:hypothetical protein